MNISSIIYFCFEIKKNHQFVNVTHLQKIRPSRIFQPDLQQNSDKNRLISHCASYTRSRTDGFVQGLFGTDGWRQNEVF